MFLTLCQKTADNNSERLTGCVAGAGVIGSSVTTADRRSRVSTEITATVRTNATDRVHGDNSNCAASKLPAAPAAIMNG